MTTPSGPSLAGQAGRRVQALLDSLQIDQSGESWSLLPFLLATVDLPQPGQLATGNTSLPGVAAERNGIQLLNPAGSGVDIQVIAIWGRGDAAAAETNIVIQLSDVALGTPVAGLMYLDRQHGTQAPIGLINAEADWTVVGQRGEQIAVLQDTTYHSVIAPHVTLPPGTGIVTTPSVVDEDQLTNFLWRESPARR